MIIKNFLATIMKIFLQKNIFLVVPIFTQLFWLTLSQPDIQYYTCLPKGGNFTNNTTYQTNLNTLLSSLPSRIDDYGFSNYSFGQNPNTVYGLALCRSDLDSSNCRTCIRDVLENLTQSCGNYKEVVGWNGYCTVRYSGNSVYQKLSYEPNHCLYNSENATDKGQFSKDLKSLLNDLRARAAQGVRRKFATGNITGSDLMTILGLVQCTPDLSEKECTDCLVLSMGRISSCSEGKIGGIVFWPSCTLRYETYPFYGDVAGPKDEKAVFKPLAPPPTSTPSSTGTGTSKNGKSSSRTKTIIIVVIASIATIMVFSLCFCLFLKKRKLKKRSLKSSTKDQSGNVDDIKMVESLQFDFSTVSIATDNFSDGNKLGFGGFGIVYKGILTDGREIAVKRLSENSHQGEIEFKNEVMLVAKLQHRNLVRLLGFSYKQNERLLMYEFMTNSSLDNFIFDPVKQTILDWDKRYKIIGGIARGLLYLHEDSRLRIIHRDLKASNVLLDDEMNAKISDFGMARLFVMDETHGSTSRIVGTYGYMAPEYAMHGHFSVKSDVFSFGVLVLEIVCGQKNSYFCKGEMGEDLLTFTWNSWRQGKAMELVDPSLMSATYSTREIMRCIHIGLLCVQENPIDRPTMAQVVMMLTSTSLSLPLPSEPAFFLQSNASHESSDSRYKFLHSSDNEASITELYPR